MNVDLFFIVLICLLVLYTYYDCNEPFADTTSINVDQIKNAIREVYNADVEAIRNLSDVAIKLQAGGLTVPGDLSTIGNSYLGDQNKNKWILHAPNDDRGLLSISRVKRDGVINWGTGIELLTSTDGSSAVSFNTGGKIKEKGNDLVPRGIIVAWSGSTAPAGWALCDGQNGTPDLRGRFIRGASDTLTGDLSNWSNQVIKKDIKSDFDNSFLGNSRTDPSSWIFKLKIGDYGGTDHQMLSVNELPSHNHAFEDGFFAENRPWSTKYGKVGGLKGADVDYDNQVLMANSTTSNTGSGWGHNNIPPFYVLAYIMKL